MPDLRTRFGRLVAAHRRRAGLTQEELAEAAGISVDMISKLEGGGSGARFGVIERLADALDVDPAELFTTEIPSGLPNRERLIDFTSRLALLSEADLAWVAGLLDAGMLSRSAQLPGMTAGSKVQKQGARKR